MSDNVIDVLIVGAGPAGLSAAVYASRAGLSTTVLTGDTAGGLLTTTEKIDNYLGMYDSDGDDMADIFTEHAQKFGAELLNASATRIVKTDGNKDTPERFVTTVSSNASGIHEITSRSVIYAAGSTPKKLGVPGEDLSGVSYCATCDGIFFSDQNVAVVGGGETAAEEALYLSGLANKVNVLVRGDQWRANEPSVEKLKAVENIDIKMSSSIASIREEKSDGSFDEGMVSSVVLDDNSVLDVSGVFVAIGQSPNSELAAPHSTLFEDGFVQCSNVDGFFVAGDISVSEYRQVAVAVGDGAKAGIDATRYLM